MTEQPKSDERRVEVCNQIIQLLFAHGFTKFNFRGSKSKYKLDVLYDDWITF